MSSSGFNVIRRHSSDAASIRIKELTQALAKQASDLAGSQLETDDVRSQGRMDHSTIKLNDERLKFVTTLSASNTDFFYEFPSEPDLQYLKVWFMLDHLGARMRDMSGFGNDAHIAGHPTLRRANLDIGFQQTVAGGGTAATPAMLFNSGIDVVSQKNGEYLFVVDNESIQFTKHAAGFSVHFRFAALSFLGHVTSEFGTFVRRFASKTDDALNGWNIVLYATNTEGTQGGIEMSVLHNGVEYKRRTTGYALNTWYQIAITYDPNVSADNRIKIYTGGIETSLPGIATLIISSFTNLRIGARDAETGFFYGYLQDFRMYMGKVLTQQEVTNISNNDMTIDNITKGHVFVIQYAMVSQAMRSRTHKYNVGGTVTRVRRHKFNVIARITRTRTHKFNMIIGVPTRTRTHKFNIVKLVTRTRTHKFSMGGTVRNLTKTHKFNITQKITRTRTHKFNIGGLQTQYQRFTKSITAGSNIVQEITYTSTPQVLIVWSDGNTQDNTFANQFATYYGYSDGTHHACVSGISKDSVTTTDTFSGHKNDKVISLMDNTVNAVVAEATVSFGANKATFNWTTNDTRAVYIHTMALWGLGNAEVKTFEVDTTSTGNKIYTLNNTSMTPTFLNTISIPAVTGWFSTNAQSIQIGAAVSSSKQFSIVNVNEDGNSAGADVATSYATDHCLVSYDDDNAGTQEYAAQLVSFGSGNGQFTLNYTDPISVATRVFSVLALDIPNVDVGLITQPAATGTQVINTDTNVNGVAGLMIFSNAQTTGTTQSTAQLSIGGASGTGSTVQGVVTTGENDAANPTETARINRTGKIIKTIGVNGTVASSTTTSEADLSSVATQDQFTLNWTTADATARKSHYIVFGR
jgi:hypothetical protein